MEFDYSVKLFFLHLEEKVMKAAKKDISDINRRDAYLSRRTPRVFSGGLDLLPPQGSRSSTLRKADNPSRSPLGSRANGFRAASEQLLQEPEAAGTVETAPENVANIPTFGLGDRPGAGSMTTTSGLDRLGCGPTDEEGYVTSHVGAKHALSNGRKGKKRHRK